MSKIYTLKRGILFSLSIVLFLTLLNLLNDPFLRLPLHWLLIALLPVLVALFIGGYVTELKGFGFELKNALNTPVNVLSLTKTADVIAKIPRISKATAITATGYFEDNEIARWLVFETGKKKFYTVEAIQLYIKALVNLEYFEVRTENDGIVCFIPVSVFKNNVENIQRFINAIEKNKVPDAFPGTAITLKVSSDRDIVTVLKEMRSERADFAAVISKSGKYLGVVSACDIEKKIIDAVVSISTTH